MIKEKSKRERVGISVGESLMVMMILLIAFSIWRWEYIVQYLGYSISAFASFIAFAAVMYLGRKKYFSDFLPKDKKGNTIHEGVRYWVRLFEISVFTVALMCCLFFVMGFVIIGTAQELQAIRDSQNLTEQLQQSRRQL